MNNPMNFARRHPAGAAAMAGLALFLLPATLLSYGRAHQAEPATSARAASSGPGASEQTADARAFLASVRGASPVVCELAAQSLGNGWGWGSGEIDDVAALVSGSEEAGRYLTWMSDRSFTAADVAAMRAGLSDPDACVRRMAARMLSRDGVPGGVDALLDALRSGEANARNAAILGLGSAGDARAVGPLTNLAGDTDPGVRAAVAWALGHTASHDAVASVSRLTGDREARVRRSAARALGRLEDSSSIPTLSRLLASDPDPGVRRAAAWALGQIE